MSEQTWQDNITGTRYRCGDIWVQHVQAALAAAIQVELQQARGLRDAANRVAEFWRDSYYQQLFPLRFGRSQDAQGLFILRQPMTTDADVVLNERFPLRQNFLDGAGWPPIWPDPVRGEAGWLMVDRLLIEAALLNVLLRQAQPIDETTYHAARLAALTYPLAAELRSAPWMEDKVQEISALFTSTLLQTEAVLGRLGRIVSAISKTTANQVAQTEVGLVVVAGQRIKQYVFDTPGLNEIRGGSTLLDQVTEALTRRVGQEIGPEVVLRAGGSTLLFIAPANETLASWPLRLRRAFFDETKIAFPAAAEIRVRADLLVDDFGDAVGQVFQAMGEDRAKAQLPRYETYPFETRCALCQTRAAYKWEKDPEDNDRPICEVCQTKRESGRSERRDKILDVLVDLGITDYKHPNVELNMLGVKGATRKEWVADDLEMLIPPKVRRKLIGVVYGDGNNFGAVQINMKDMALNLQWAARVAYTTRAAVALALGQATQKVAQLHGWQPGGPPVLAKLPFQLLAMGGDDLSLFAWGPVAVQFANDFTSLTDLELKVSRQDPDKSRPDLNFSLGILLTDEKTPVRKSVQFVEDELLKWAKQANQQRKLTCGTIAMLYAEKADKMPAALQEYRQEMYLLGLGRQFQLCTTLRPYTAAELTGLVSVAAQVLAGGHLGRLQRLVSAFYGARQGAFAGMLHYAYQKGRFKDGGWIVELEQALETAMKNQVQGVESALLIDYRVVEPQGETEDEAPQGKPKRTPFGLARQADAKGIMPLVRFSPLWDLLELAKLMS